MSVIGLLNEGHLHASLKEWYAEPGDRSEVGVDGFVIDLVRGDLLVEIQTRGFASLKSKLLRLIRSSPVRLVHPIAEEKWITKLAGENDAGTDSRSGRRKSPKKGRIEDLFWELVRLPHLPAHSNFSLEVLLTKEEERRRFDGRRGWRRKGWVTEERRLIEVVGRRLFATQADWCGLIPVELRESFTAGDLAETLGIVGPLAQRMAYCLRQAGMVQLVGKRGRAYLYGTKESAGKTAGSS
jgi:hypothetical protein